MLPDQVAIAQDDEIFLGNETNRLQAAGENLIKNGSFEEPQVNGKFAIVASSQVPHWVASDGFVEIDRTPWPASVGVQSTDLNTNGPIMLWQNVSGLVPGATYQLTFDYATNNFGRVPGPRTMDVSVDGTVLASYSSNRAAPNYISESLTFSTPASGWAVIGFASTNAGSAGVVLDNVELREIVLPTTPQVTNGSFENPWVEKFSILENIPGWNVVSGPVEIDRSPWPAAGGEQSMDLNASQGSHIEQVLTGLMPGKAYVVSFAYGAHKSIAKAPGQSATASVLLDGTTAMELRAGVADIPPAYKTGQVSFVAPESGSKTVGFAGLGSDSRGVVIDDVALSPLSDPLVINGSFELPDLSQDPQLRDKWDYVPSIPGWTTVQGEVEIMGPPSDGGAWPASEGEQSLDLGANEPAGPNATIIEQRIPGIVPGVPYELTFDYGKHSRTRATRVSANVYIDGHLVGTLGAGKELILAYRQAVVPFTASGSAVTIAFEHTTPGFSQGLTLDNVRIRLAN